MKINIFLFSILSITGISVILLFSTEDNTSNGNNIWIECESAESITEPIEIIDMEGASKGKAIVSTGYHHYHIGRAVYNMNLPKDNYHFWVRAYWPLVCSNSYKMKINGGSFMYIGNTSILNKWHWIKGPLLELKSNDKLEIWNDEVNSCIDKILLTTNSNFIPTGTGESNELNFDFEDLNILGIKFQNKKNWQIINDDYLTNNRLYLKPVKKSETAIINASCTNSYVYQLCFKGEDDYNIFMLFDYLDLNNHYGLSIFENSINLFKKVENEEKPLKKIALPKNLIKKDLYCLTVIKSEGRITIKLDGKTIIDTFDNTFAGGKVGFGSDKGNVYFDNINFLTDLEPYYNNDYHQINFFYATKNLPEIHQEYIKNKSRSVIHYWQLEGNWEDERNGAECYKGMKNSNKDALVLFGHPYWNNYSFRCGVQAPADGKGIGVCFNAQDSSNYYLFRWSGNDLSKKLELIKQVSGKTFVINSKQIRLENLQWYSFQVKRKADSINIYLDDHLVMSNTDTTFFYGRIGYWTNSNTGAFFDDIALGKTTTLNNKVEKNFNYIFHADNNVGYSLSGWFFDNPNILKHNNWGNDTYNNHISLQKEKGENTYIWHKKEISTKFNLLWYINNENIPNDVFVVFNFSNSIESFKVIVEASEIKLLKNNYLLATSQNFAPRNKIEISCSDSTWDIKVNNIVYLNHSVNIAGNSFKMNFGFEGKGNANIDLSEIRLKTE